MQCEQCHWSGSTTKSSALETLRTLLKEEGPLRLFRGVSTMLGASLPAHALYFSVFESAKKTFGANRTEPTPLASGKHGFRMLSKTEVDVLFFRCGRSLRDNLPRSHYDTNGCTILCLVSCNAIIKKGFLYFYSS